ncbi:MAG: hypothetical protein H6711_02845 [Myxococcales bacterium]|nr:hypothetical protein [Myxococcales bacterium]
MTDASASGSGSATDSSGTSGSTSTTASTSASGTTTTSETTTASTTDSGSSSGTGSTTAVDPTTTGGNDPVCGNGLLEEGEECDDGDNIDKNYCSNSCVIVPCDQQEGNGEMMFDYSYIWIANSNNGTVSKIDTETLVELGRYATDPSSGASPSRTAVNVDGRFAAVANRTAGTIAAFAADEADCVDKNNDGVITTSTGPGDVKPFGQDECMLWHIAVDPNPNNNQKGPRPLGWDFEDQDPVTCKWQTHTLWAGWYSNGPTAYFWHIDGTDGTVLDEVDVPDWGNNNAWGPYGGAVDKDHNFWAAGWHGPLLKINSQDLSYKLWKDPVLLSTSSYGMALDGQGQPWFGGCSGEVTYFDTQSETVKNLGDTGGCLRGLMVDKNGTAWIAGNGGCRLVEVDTINKVIKNPNIPIPGCSTPVGISIDAKGFVWIVDQKGVAYKMDPMNYTFQQVSGLVGPYTYSDMTGAGIQLQAMPQ